MFKKLKNLTVIIPTFNSSHHLRQCLSSLEKQNYKNYQVYVVDGGSRDDTLKIFKEYKFLHKIISRKDVACADGLNKCIKKINTKYFMILGSDDVLGDKNYIKNLIIFLIKSASDIVLPQFGIIQKDLKKIVLQSKDFNCLHYKTIVPGFGWIAKTKIFYNQKFNFKRYKIANDYEMFLRLYKKKYIFNRNDDSYYYFRMGGNSLKYYPLALREQKLIALKANGPFFKIYLEFYRTNFKFFIKQKLLNFLKLQFTL